jgi:hypothetical protein
MPCPYCLRVGLDDGEEVHRSRIFRGMEQYDWLQNRLFIGRGLCYGQDFFNEELQAWMKEGHGCQHGNTFC